MPVIVKSNLGKQQELQALNEAIAERKRYYREQERLIVDLVEAGNTQLMCLHHEILLAKQELRNLRTDIRTFSQDKVLLIRDIEGLQLKVGGILVL